MSPEEVQVRLKDPDSSSLGRILELVLIPDDGVGAWRLIERVPVVVSRR